MGKNYKQLSAEERGVIFAMKFEDKSTREIARALVRSPSTISRELKRNDWKPAHERSTMGRPAIAGGYNPRRAGLRAGRLRRKPRRARKLRVDGPLWPQVRELLARFHSPEQISAQLERAHPDEPALNVSHETIYHAIYAMPRGELKRELIALLRRGRSTRRPRSRGEDRRGKLNDMVSIHVRPPRRTSGCLPGTGKAISSRGQETARRWAR